jgi:hypothetical protein
MKKLLLFVSITSIATPSLQAVHKQDIETDLVSRVNLLNLAALSEVRSISEQQQAVTQWDTSVNKALTFVRENSTDLLKKQDPALISGISKIQALNNDLTNTIKVIRGSLPNAPISRLLTIAAEAKKFIDEQSKKTFTLPSKKDANAVLIFLARRIDFAATNLYKDLVAKK